MNVENQPLVKLSKILLSSVRFKLGLMKNFVKAMNQEEAAFTYLQEKFPRLSETKLKGGIVVTSTGSFKVTKRRLGTVLNL